VFLLMFYCISCKSLPPALPDIPDMEAGAPEDIIIETVQEEETADENEAAVKEQIEEIEQIEETEDAEIIVRAEELIEPSDKYIDVDLVEPSYNFNEPEVIADTASPQEGDMEASAEIALNEPVEEESPVEEAPMLSETPPPAAPPPQEPPVEETLEEEILEEEIPPPPPDAAMRPSELLDTTPPVPRQAPEPVRALPVLTARDPAVETIAPVKPSRVIYAGTGRPFEIPFQGTGWVYIGEENSKPGINYDSRRIEGNNQIFVFRAQKEGEYTLKFYRQDFLKDYYTNEYVRVIVDNNSVADEQRGGETSGSNTMPAVAGLPVENNSPAPADDSAGIDAETAAPLSPENFLQQAREAFAAKSYAGAISLLDNFQRQYPEMNDEAWWLYGQALENAPQPDRDVRGALEAYSYLTREYPGSKFYKNAQNRIAFLNKFYFNIR
jgi:hypothetical protein